jgi:hypothetical protein
MSDQYSNNVVGTPIDFPEVPALAVRVSATDTVCPTRQAVSRRISHATVR